MKKVYLVVLTTFLKILQFSICFETLYLSSPFWHSLFYHNFKCFVILMIFECLNQILLVSSANFCTVCSRLFLLEIFSMFSFLTASMSSAMKFFSSSLFLTITYFFGLNMLFNYYNINSEQSMVWQQSPFWMDHMIIEFWWV